jgi:hypothetical protein
MASQPIDCPCGVDSCGCRCSHVVPLRAATGAKALVERALAAAGFASQRPA